MCRGNPDRVPLLSLAPPHSDLTLDEVFEEMEAVFVRYLRPIMEGG
ncbi:MAG: hypothetical protein SF029_08265 [bacterium]|nr:hypothetical protein [bacterium]